MMHDIDAEAKMNKISEISLPLWRSINVFMSFVPTNDKEFSYAIPLQFCIFFICYASL